MSSGRYTRRSRRRHTARRSARSGNSAGAKDSVQSTPHLRPPAALTKVRVPRRRTGILSRGRLLTFLHQHLGRRLQIVVGPPGYGKTTLLVDFAHEAREQGVPVCWLSLEEGDADARSFFEHLLLSLRQCFPEFGNRTGDLLHGVDDAAREHRVIATGLCNELAEDVGEFFVLVLDDFHTVAGSPAVNDTVDWLLQRLPDGCRVVIGSRMIPTRLNLSRLAAKLDVAGLGAADLRLRPEEASELIRLHRGYDPSAQEAARLVRQAEGWVTALLLALHAPESGGISNLTRAKAQQEPVYEYLATQVFEHLTPPLQQFLMESAVVPTLSVKECDAILDREDSADRLAEIVQASLFIEPLETEAEAEAETARAEQANGRPASLAYHQLWHEFLLKRLAMQDPQRLTALRRRAADRALELDDVPGAVEHLLSTSDGAEAAQLILAHAEAELVTGRAARLLSWIERLPKAATESQPMLLVHAARALRRLDRVKESLQQAEQAERVASATRQWDAAYLARAWRAEMLALLGDGNQAVAILADLFDQLNRQPRGGELRARIEKEGCITLGVAQRYKEALTHAASALDHLHHIRNPDERRHVAAIVHHMAGICRSRLGEVQDAEAHFQIAERLWRRLGNVTQQARVFNGMGLLQQSARKMIEAEATFRRGLELAERVGHVSTQVILLNNLARCQREAGALAEARVTIERSLPLARQAEETWLLGEALQEAGVLALKLGNALEAGQVLEGSQDVAEQSWPAGLPLTRSLLALVYARAGQRPEARQMMGEARQALAAARSVESRLRCSVALAAATGAMQGNEDAVADLRVARRWARDRDVLAPFFMECAQYAETARLMLAERRLPPGVEAALRAAADADARYGRTTRPPEHRLRAVPHAPASSQFEIHLFGMPALIRNGESIRAWRTNLVRELLCFLVLRGGNTVRTEAILDALLPEADYDRSLTSLRQSIYHLRRLFAPLDPVRTVRGGYRLSLEETITCDVREFQQLLARSRTARGDEATKLLEAALELYRAPLLDGLDAEWVVTPRADMERQFLSAAQALLSAYAQASRHDAAVALAERVLAVDPYQGEFHLAILRHQVAQGHSAAARHHYKRYSRVMRDELGQEPDPEATRIVSQLTGRVRAAPA